MGWLRDFMTTADPPIASFGKLAELALDHEQWPVDLKPKSRSLSTLFSKLDREKDLDWLRDRIEVQRVLAALLGRALGDLRGAIGEVPRESGSRYIRLIDVRYAREIDLTQEDLPPGIPRSAFEPPTWGPTWWYAPSGSGRSLVSAWLRARGLAHTATIREREDLDRLPSRGALFLELDSSLKPDDVLITASDLEKLRAYTRPICISAGFPAPPLRIETLTSPEPRTYLPELVDWVEERLDGTGHFQADRVENWMRKVALPAGAVNNFGDALGLLGMADEVHPRSLLAKSLDELGEHFVRSRVREASEQFAASPRMGETAFEALKECAARILVSGENTLHSSHPLDEWTALLAAPQADNAPDPEWFTSALSGALGAQVSRKDLRRAAQKLPPSAFQLTRSLEAARILVRDPSRISRDEKGADRHLHPRWLVSLLSSRASQEVLRLPPSQWGRVLLAGTSADRIVSSLLDAAHRDNFAAGFSLVDDYDASHPEFVAALEGCVVATGLALLEGADVPEELIEGLLVHLAEDLLIVDRLPEPHLTMEGDGTGLFCRHHFLVAFAALCAEVPFPLPHWDPLRAASESLRAHFETACAAALRAPGLPPGRAVGILRLQNALHPENTEQRAAPLRLLDTLSAAPPQLFREALALCPVDTLLAYTKQAGRNEAPVYQAVWRYAVDRTDPGVLFLSPEALKNFWRNIPGDDLRARVRKNLSVPWDVLLPHQFSEWFSHEDSPPLPASAARVAPLDVALTYLEKRGTHDLDDESLTLLVGRAGARIAPLLARAYQTEDGVQATRLLALAPKEASADIARTLPDTAQILSFRAPLVQAIRAFLLRATRARHPNFGECYARLRLLEQGLGPLRNLP